VLVFSRAADGTFSQETASPLAARRLSDNARFGATLVFDGDKLLVGAPGAIFVPQVEREAAEEGAQRGGGRRGGFGAGVGMVVEFDRNAQSGAWIERAMVTAF